MFFALTVHHSFFATLPTVDQPKLHFPLPHILTSHSIEMSLDVAFSPSISTFVHTPIPTPVLNNKKSRKRTSEELDSSDTASENSTPEYPQNDSQVNMKKR
jgi:hypothetical protein